MNKEEIKNTFYKPFENIKSRKGRGGTYDYVSWKNVADRMNEVFGMNWTSEVRTESIIDDNVIIRVSVCARDEETGQMFCQEGYGGAVKRGSDEAGSAHKSAYSKALKDACKKWGIGLYLEDITDDDSGKGYSMPQGYTGYETGKSNNPASSTSPVANPVPPVDNSGNSHGKKSSSPVPPSMPLNKQTTNNKPTTNGSQTPPVPGSNTKTTQAPTPPTPGALVPNANMGAPMKNSNPGVPPTPPTGGNKNSASSNKVDYDKPGSITNVQEIAIKNLVKLTAEGDDITVEEYLTKLVDDTNCELNRKVNSLEELSYKEAVSVIKSTKTE